MGSRIVNGIEIVFPDNRAPQIAQDVMRLCALLIPELDGEDAVSTARPIALELPTVMIVPEREVVELK